MLERTLGRVVLLLLAAVIIFVGHSVEMRVREKEAQQSPDDSASRYACRSGATQPIHVSVGTLKIELHRLAAV